MYRVTYVSGNMLLTRTFNENQKAEAEAFARQYNGNVVQVNGTQTSTNTNSGVNTNTAAGIYAASNPNGLRTPDAIDAWKRQAAGQNGNQQNPNTDTGSNPPKDDDSVEETAMKNARVASGVIRATASRIPGFSEAELNQIAGIAKKLSLEGYSNDAIALMIEDSAPYQRRFIANSIREKNGDTRLSIPEYLALENEYENLIENYADLFPDGSKFKTTNKKMKSPEAFITSWLVGDVDPQELETRFLTARRWASDADPNLKAVLNQYYGIGEKEIAQWALASDEDKDTILQMYQTTLIGSEALGQDLSLDKELAQTIVAKDIGQQQARQAFSEVAKEQETIGVLSGIEGTTLTQDELIKSELNIDAKAAKKTKAIKAKEEARFSGTGAGTSILGSSTSGMI